MLARAISRLGGVRLTRRFRNHLRRDAFAHGHATPEAMLLYDLEVDQLWTLSVAELFTVADGTITRIRQIHDTTALRAAGFAPST